MGPAQFMEFGVEDDAQIADERTRMGLRRWMTRDGVAPSQRVWRALGHFQRWVVSVAKAFNSVGFDHNLGDGWFDAYMAKCRKHDPLVNATDQQLVQFKPDCVLLHVVWMRAIVLRLEQRDWWGEFSAKLEDDLFSQNLPSCIAFALQNMFKLDRTTQPKTLKQALFMHAHHASRTLQDTVVRVDRARRERRDQAQIATIQRVEPQAPPQQHEVQQQAERQHEAVPFSVAAANAAREAKRMRAAEAAEADEWADTECPSP